MKKLLSLLTALTLLLASCLSTAAFGAETANKLQNVSLTITDAGELQAGALITAPTAKTNGNGYLIADIRYENDHVYWQKSERPKVTITLEALDGYKFVYTEKSHFTLLGFGATYSSAQITDGGMYLTLTIYLQRVKGTSDTATDYALEWSGDTATWESPYDDVDMYEVRLYKWNNSGSTASMVASKRTFQTTYEFAAYMTVAGSYSFRVRPIDLSTNDTSEIWSDYSEKLAVDSDTAEENKTAEKPSGYTSSNPSVLVSGTDEATYGGPNVAAKTSSPAGNADPAGTDGALSGSGSDSGSSNGYWKSDENGWWYHYYDGSFPAGTWQDFNGSLYYFNENGYMVTGWLPAAEGMYYCGADGVRVTGWQKIGSSRYYFNENGLLCLGWTAVDGKLYYLDPATGALWTGCYTPDGHYVNATGVQLY